MKGPTKSYYDKNGKLRLTYGLRRAAWPMKLMKWDNQGYQPLEPTVSTNLLLQSEDFTTAWASLLTPPDYMELTAEQREEHEAQRALLEKAPKP